MPTPAVAANIKLFAVAVVVNKQDIDAHLDPVQRVLNESRIYCAVPTSDR